MGARGYIVCGLRNAWSFCSAPHGAGRRHSRGEAKRLFTAEDLAAQTAGVECRKDLKVLGEISSAQGDFDWRGVYEWQGRVEEAAKTCSKQKPEREGMVNTFTLEARRRAFWSSPTAAAAAVRS